MIVFRRAGLLVVMGSVVVCVVSVAILRSQRPRAVPPAGVHVDAVLVQKGAHTLKLLQKGRVIKTYRVALGRGGPGDKLRAGDNKVPEGVYRIVGRNPHSAFHLALRLGYPTPAQVAVARARGIDPGGDIMIHGIRNGLGWLGPLQREVDWTKGCVAVTDAEIEEIWRVVPDGAMVEVQQ